MKCDKATYKEIPRLIENREPFKGNSASAHYDGTEYQVRSYHTKIASVNENGEWWISSQTYSPTTSRIQNIVREISKQQA